MRVKLFRKRLRLVQEGRLEEADQQAQLALSNPQTRAVAYSVLGAIRFQQKRLPESVSLLEKAIHLDPRLLGAQLSLAEVYYRTRESLKRLLRFTAASSLWIHRMSPQELRWRGRRPRRETTADRWSCAGLFFRR